MIKRRLAIILATITLAIGIPVGNALAATNCQWRHVGDSYAHVCKK